MSFCDDLKEQITGATYKSRCCRRALLFGIISSKAVVVDGMTVLTLANEERSDFAAALVKEAFGSSADIHRRKNGGRCYELSWSDRHSREYLENLSYGEKILIEKCPSCRASFIRGVFLATGRVTDPEKMYYMELTTGVRTPIFDRWFRDIGLEPSTVNRGGVASLCFRNSSGIEEFFANAGLNNAMFSVIEAKFNGEAKRNIHRVTNCIANNIQKAVDAAAKQVALIKRLEKSNLLSSLPEELESTARLRLEYPDLSLAQLSAISVPKVTKPGLSHRLKKIMELGEELLKKD